MLRLDEAHACVETRDLAARKLQIVQSKLADLAAVRKALSSLMRQCDSTDGAAACPIIRALATD